MKQNIILFGSLSIALFFGACTNEQKPAQEPSAAVEDASYILNTDTTSRVLWKGIMLGVKEHTGTIDITEGKITTKGGLLVAGNFTINMQSIKTTDKNYNAAAGYPPEKLLAHLASADFFDIANYPVATFIITSVNNREVTGTMKLRGKENTETVKDITVTEANGVVTAKGTLTFNRKKYDVSFDTGAKDMVISDDIVLEITLTGKK